MEKYELIEHLRITLDLEVKCYGIENIIKFNESKRQRTKELPQKPYLRELGKNGIPSLTSEPTPPVKSDIRTQPANYGHAFGESAIVSFVAAAIIIALLCFTKATHFNINFPFSPLLPGFVGYAVTFVLIFLTVFSIMLGILLLYYEDEHKKELQRDQEYAKSSYQCALKRYNSELENCRRINLRRRVEVEEYNRGVTERYRKAYDEIEAHNSKAETANKQLDQIQRPLVRTFQRLQKTLGYLYELGFVYFKYRNLLAYGAFLEYFESGRCEELEGTYGAYNLFENEFRLDGIIERLDLVIHYLDQIQKNQYYLYREIQRVNSNIEQLTSCICDGLNQIANTRDYLSYHAYETREAAKMISRNIDDYVAGLERKNKEVLKYLEESRRLCSRR